MCGGKQGGRNPSEDAMQGSNNTLNNKVQASILGMLEFCGNDDDRSGDGERKKERKRDTAKGMLQSGKHGRISFPKRSAFFSSFLYT
mmetsp:Transcript_20359/g.41928  ORF Transcript_20359/g.41928 Transcript_20359/m.41928 type:complete len:87 (-) Transcript_20359:55-315(-)